ncbi:hypothetical protein [Bifidobacterium crudilactis]|jgi:hypothetical protein|uniref:hypothetical protein n=1 Tax=Bifidobacterium crudilactis TaxID=327277 RepID=UPI002648D4DE|nr:hypothetical protein [Bifidobacterium crudilactis]MDN6446546.1 hypothetical protein [Lacticaseibacillus paracasei]MDN5972155.1 hypothetical protein [Bifidobacterium crudilactis]MDN6000667.1 hypothetical protein [Bifidobacterium crudilactis]MDN6208550.1 hypothetical protein [Bifidobacterium crudilactis]MDN6467624.1 hypothetical protein [Bifidobacterium crudilactis]
MQIIQGWSAEIQSFILQPRIIMPAVVLILALLGYTIWRLPTWRLQSRLDKHILMRKYAIARESTNFSGETVTTHSYPRVSNRKRTSYGFVFRLRLQNGLDVQQLEDNASGIAAHLKLWKIEIEEDEPGYALVLAYRKHSQAPKPYSSHELWKEQHS